PPRPSRTNHSIPLNNVADVIHYGSTAAISRVRPGVLLKLPYEPNTEGPHVGKVKESVAHAFSVEKPILEMLGSHPRIHQGIFLGEASHGSLQAYLDNNNSAMPLCLRKKWCKQACEATDYIHSRGVIHADMRPENFLIHESTAGSLDLLLCDFGGAKCEKLRLWPYRSSSGPFSSVEEMLEYTTKVNELFLQGQYPSVAGLVGGNVIMGCWLKKYKTVGEVLIAGIN
ncbi:kinase-like protein, partial [Penicillium hispanicum]|uniref:kinase-like protein n=1 Tax=Penicillium hispanicum TaxID=1080232 RepID=UPI002541D947